MRKIKLLSYILSLLILSGTVMETFAKEFNLNEYLKLVEQQSKSLKLAEKDREEAQAEKKQAVSLALPQLSAKAEYTRNLSNLYMYINFPGGDVNTSLEKLKLSKNNEYSASVVLSQTIFSGQVIHAITAAKEYEQLTTFMHAATYQQIMTYAKQAFYQVLLLEKVFEVQKLSKANAYDNYMDVKNAYNNGLASEYQLLQAEVRYREAIPQTTEAERNLELALISIKNLSGIPIDSTITIDGTLETFPEKPDTMTMQTILKKRPDYNALLWQEKLYKTNLSAEKSTYFPTLSAVAAYGYSAESDAWKFENENNSYTVGLNLSLPIFEGGARRAKVRKASIQLEKSQIAVQQQLDDIEKEIRSLRLQLDEAYTRIESSKSALTTAKKAFSIAEATAKTGLTSQLELKDSRVMLDQMTVGYYAAIFEYLVAYFNWEQAIGSVSDSGRYQFGAVD